MNHATQAFPSRRNLRRKHQHLRPRRLICEILEDRRVLSAAVPSIEVFGTSPALFVENQGQWADEEVRFLHNGQGANVAMTDAGPVFQLVRQEPVGDGSGADPVAYQPEEYRTETLVFSASFVDATLVEPVGRQQSDATFNYFLGSQQDW